MTDFASRRLMMVDTQVRPSDVTKFPIIDAMLRVPRETFVPSGLREAAYADEILNVGSGRQMLDPRTLAKMLDALDISNDDLVLDIAGGLGYSTAVVAQIAEAVIMIESDEGLVEEAQQALVEIGADNAIVQQGVLAEGAAEHGPYDVILVQGGVEQVSEGMQDQLKEGGRIACIFMNGKLGEVRIGLKTGGRITWRLSFNAAAPVLPGFEKEAAFAL